MIINNISSLPNIITTDFYTGNYIPVKNRVMEKITATNGIFIITTKDSLKQKREIYHNDIPMWLNSSLPLKSNIQNYLDKYNDLYINDKNYSEKTKDVLNSVTAGTISFKNKLDVTA